MTREELFAKYHIEDSHNEWDNSIDNWMSVEIFRIMHYGRLPQEGDTSILYVLDFRDRFQADDKFRSRILARQDWGRLRLTSSRMICLYADSILKELNQSK